MKHPLTAYREKNGLSIAALAARVDCSRQTIWRIENGKRMATMRLIVRLVMETKGAVSANDFMPEQVR